MAGDAVQGVGRAEALLAASLPHTPGQGVEPRPGSSRCGAAPSGREGCAPSCSENSRRPQDRVLNTPQPHPAPLPSPNVIKAPVRSQGPGHCQKEQGLSRIRLDLKKPRGSGPESCSPGRRVALAIGGQRSWAQWGGTHYQGDLDLHWSTEGFTPGHQLR